MTSRYQPLHNIEIYPIIYRISSIINDYNCKGLSQKVLWNENPRIGFQHYHWRSRMRSPKFTPQIICSRSRQCHDPQYLQPFRLKAQSEHIVPSQSTQIRNMYSNTKISKNRDSTNYDNFKFHKNVKIYEICHDTKTTVTQTLKPRAQSTKLLPSSASLVVPNHPQIQSHTTTVVAHDIPGG